jgi:hypothetical protein
MKSKLYTEKPSNAWTLLLLPSKALNDCFSLVKFSNICQAQETIEVKYSNLHGTLVAGGAILISIVVQHNK